MSDDMIPTHRRMLEFQFILYVGSSEKLSKAQTLYHLSIYHVAFVNESHLLDSNNIYTHFML